MRAVPFAVCDLGIRFLCYSQNCSAFLFSSVAVRELQCTGSCCAKKGRGCCSALFSFWLNILWLLSFCAISGYSVG